MGMTFPQVVVFMGSLVVWSIVAFSMDLGLMARLVMFGPAHAVTVVMFTVKIGGVLVPLYLLLMVKGMIFAPLYHSSDAEMRGGLPELQAQRERMRHQGDEAEALPESVLGRLLYGLKRLRKGKARQARAEAAREMRYLTEVEVEHRGHEAVREGKHRMRSTCRIMRISAVMTPVRLFKLCRRYSPL